VAGIAVVAAVNCPPRPTPMGQVHFVGQRCGANQVAVGLDGRDVRGARYGGGQSIRISEAVRQEWFG
jgi:hypothetical protein